jgi:hypothetical protein
VLANLRKDEDHARSVRVAFRIEGEPLRVCSPKLEKKPAGVIPEEVVDSVDLLFVPVGEDFAHHVLARIGVLSEGLEKETR